MNKKIKQIITTSVGAALTLTSIAVASHTNYTNTDTASAYIYGEQNNISNQTTNTQYNRIGKIVETSNSQKNNTYTANNGATYLNTASEDTASNNQTPTNELFVLSENPYISFSSNNDSARFNMILSFKRNGEASQEYLSNAKSKFNSMGLKRSLLSIYLNELYTGNISLSTSAQTEIENKLNQLNSTNTEQTNTSSYTNNTSRQANYSNKAQVMDDIIEILENNLSSNSSFYGKKLSDIEATLLSSSSSASNNYKNIADKIAKTFEICNVSFNTTSTNNENLNTANINSATTNNNATTNSINLANKTTQNSTTTRNQTQGNYFGRTNPTTNRNDITNNTILRNSNNSQNNISGQVLNNNISNSNMQSRGLNNNNTTEQNSTNYNLSNSTKNENNQENTQSRKNINNYRTMRADRTPADNNYISSNPKYNNFRPRATRTPYTQNENAVR